MEDNHSTLVGGQTLKVILMGIEIMSYSLPHWEATDDNPWLGQPSPL